MTELAWKVTTLFVCSVMLLLLEQNQQEGCSASTKAAEMQSLRACLSCQGKVNLPCATGCWEIQAPTPPGPEQRSVAKGQSEELK